MLTDQNLFFVTTTTKNHERLFASHDSCCFLVSLLAEVVKSHQAHLFGYVIMPTHVHLLLGIQGGGPALSRLMRDFKSLSWRRMFSGRPGIWAARFDDVAIYTEDQFRTKLNYIHQNPVRAGLAKSADEYQFSSARVWDRGESDGLTDTSLTI